MDLILVNNDPTRTLLVSSDGIPVYSVGTLPSVPVPSQANTTTVTRLERGSSSSSGRTQAEVGRIQYQTDDPNVRLSLNQCLEERPEFSLEIVKEFESGGDDEQRQRHVSFITARRKSNEYVSYHSSWSFTGPDDRPYKWQIFIQYPIVSILPFLPLPSTFHLSPTQPHTSSSSTTPPKPPSPATAAQNSA
ncbi:hypothetical protein V5O48_009081 [Marasmius crinis-equi]|uniref:DUF6593 domain-containing protein n=1 Tax=Marasmius crinis-equi TaxID=585013 RepID=A0ABR3FCF8_9AGAR